MAVAVREATTKDFEVVYQFVCELQKKVFDRQVMAQLFEKNISNPDNTYLIATNDGEAIGYLSCHIQSLLHHGGKVAEIQEMYVQDKYRNQGIGKQMMDKVKKIVQQKGALQLEVTTRMIREKAIGFYKRESFEDTHKKLVHHFQQNV